jgi:hypothetical protein
VVERQVVADQHPIPEEVAEGRHHVPRWRLVEEHRRRDAGDLGDALRDGASGVDELLEGLDHLAAADLHGSDLDHAVALGAQAGGLGVRNYEGGVGQVHGAVGAWAGG